MKSFTLGAVIRPNGSVNKRTSTGVIIGWIAFLTLVWLLITARGADTSHNVKAFLPFLNHGAPITTIIPNLRDVVVAFIYEWKSGSVYQLLVSTFLSLEAVALSGVIALGLSYLATIPMFRAPVDWIGKLRFLSLTGVLVVFIAMTKSGHALKLAVLCFSVVTFLVNDLLQVIDDIPQSRFDYAKTLGFSQWQILREVVIRGTLAQAFESLRMNAAMAWMMLTLVEGLSRSEGGIGVLLISLQRAGDYAAIFAIQFMILLVGMGQDRLIKAVKAVVCPYTVRTA